MLISVGIGWTERVCHWSGCRLCSESRSSHRPLCYQSGGMSCLIVQPYVFLNVTSFHREMCEKIFSSISNLIAFFSLCIMLKCCSAVMSFVIECVAVTEFSFSVCVYSNLLSAVLALCWTSSRLRSITSCKKPLWSSGTSSANTPTSQSTALVSDNSI